MSGDNIKVAIKVRPLLKKEKDQKSLWKIIDNSIQLIDSQSEPYYFDHIFDQNASNQDIFEIVAKPIINATLQGINGTIFAYGQTSSGKTYTMLGDETNPGVMSLAVKEIFHQIEANKERAFLIRVGYIEIYNEKIYDLLNRRNQDLKIHETQNGDISVNCEECIITSEDEMLSYLQEGSRQRRTGETNMNERSSRSHTIFRIIIESEDINKASDDNCVKISNLNLVDLAGSERADQTGATGNRLKEGGHINRSLLSLSCVINKLSENESDKFINYRDSKLTRILQASLGGNALTSIICNIKPNTIEETSSTLNFALRAKTIKNKPKINEVISEAAMLKKLQKEITKLQTELEIEKSKNSQIKILHLEKQIREEELKIMYSHSIRFGNKSSVRRRTWCPTTTVTVDNNEEIKTKEISTRATTIIGDSIMKSSRDQQTDNLMIMNDKLITLRDHQLVDDYSSNNDLPLPLPVENCFLNDKDHSYLSKTPTNSKNSTLKVEFKTPHILRNENHKKYTLRTPSPDNIYSTYKKLGEEFEELKSFTKLEKDLDIDHNNYMILCKRLDEAEEKIKRYEEEKQKYKIMEDEFYQKALQLCYFQERCQDLEKQMMETGKCLEKLQITERNYELQLSEANKRINKLEIELKDASGYQFQCEQDKKRFKIREKELIDALLQKDHEIDNFKRIINNKSLSLIQNSVEKIDKETITKNEIDEINDNKQDIIDRILIEQKDQNIRVEKLHEENQKLLNEYTELSNQIIECVQECDNLKEYNMKLQNQIEIYKNEIENIGKIIKNNSQDEFEKVNDDLTPFTVISERIENLIMIKNQKNQILTEQVKNLEEHLIQMKNENVLPNSKYNSECNDNDNFNENHNNQQILTMNNFFHNNISLSCLGDRQLQRNELKEETHQNEIDNKEKDLMRIYDFQQRFTEMEEKVKYLLNENEMMKYQNEQLEKIRKELQNNIEKLELQIQSNNDNSKKDNKVVENLKNIKNNFDKKVSMNDDENEKSVELIKRIEYLQNEIDNSKKTNSEIEIICNERIKSAQIKKSEVIRKNEELEGTLEDLQKSVGSIETEKNEVLRRNEELEKTLKELQKCVESIETEKNEVLRRNEDLQNNIVVIKSEKNESIKRLEKLNEINNDLQKSIEALKTDNEKIIRENEELQKVNSNHQMNNNDLLKSIEIIKTEREKILEENKQIQEINNKLENSMKEVENQNLNLKLQIENLQKDMMSWKDKSALLKIDKEKVENENNRLQQQMHEIQYENIKNCEQLQNEIDLFKKENDNLKSKKKQTDKINADLRLHIKNLESLNQGNKLMENIKKCDLCENKENYLRNLNDIIKFEDNENIAGILRELILNLKYEKNELLSEIHQIQIENSNSNQLIDKIEKERKELEKINKILQNDFEHVKNKIELLENNNKINNDENEKAGALQKENFELHETIRKDNIIMKQFQDECIALKTSTEELMGNLIQIEKEKIVLENEITKLKNDIKKLQSEKSILVNKISNSTKENENFKIKLNEYENESCLNGQKLEKLEEQLRIQIERNDIHCTNKKNLETKLSQYEVLNKELTDKNFQLQKIQRNYQNSEKLSNEENLLVQNGLLGAYRRRFEELQEKLIQLDDENTNLQEKIILLNNENKKYEITIKTLKESLRNSQNELSREHNEKIKYENSFDTLSGEIKELNRNLNEYNELKLKYKRIIEENTKLNEQLSKIQNRTGVLRDQMMNNNEARKGEERNLYLKIYEKEKKYLIGDKEKSIDESYVSKTRENDRKIKRHSSHDEKRFMLLDDQNKDVETMTEPTDKLCNCETLNIRIKELQKKTQIQEFHINTLRKEIKCNPLIEENKSLKFQISEKENKNESLNSEILLLKDKINQLTKMKLNLMNKSCQTECEPSNDLKTKSQISELKKQIIELRTKYEDAKQLCRMRRTEIEKLEKKLYKGFSKELKEEYDKSLRDNVILRQKYAEVKFLLESYKKEINQQ